MENATPRLVQVDRRPLVVRRAGERLPDVRHIVIVREDRLGDFVLALPALALIRATYPEARLSLVVDQAVAPLARAVPQVDRVVTTERFTGARQLARDLADVGADTLIAISRKPRAALAGRRAGLVHRVGNGGRWWSPLLTRRVYERRRGGDRHELEYALSFAHCVGAAAADVTFPIALPADAADAAAKWLQTQAIGANFVVLHPGSGGSCPAWPIGHYLRLADTLRREGIPVVFSVGPADGAVATALDGAVAFGGGLLELAALVDRARLVVSNSTGPLHLAAALDTPTLAIHAPWTSCGAARWGPYSARGWSIEVANPSVARWSRRERTRRGAAWLATLEPASVHAHVRGLLELTPTV